MKGKREFLYFIEVREKDGKRTKYPVYKDSEKYYINDHPVMTGRDIEGEIKDFFNAEVIGPVLEKPLHQDLKFKDIK